LLLRGWFGVYCDAVMGRRDGWGDWLGPIAAQPASKNNNKNDNKNKLKQGKKVKIKNYHTQ
jgi:hypothetical protein